MATDNLAALLGISEAEPGFACVRVAPEIEGVGSAAGTIAIPDGLVEVSWLKSAEMFQLDVSVPIGHHLQVRLPAAVSDELYVDGEPIPQDTQTLRTDSFVELAVLPGNRYLFEVRKRH